MKKKIIIIFLMMVTVPYSYYVVKYRKAYSYNNIPYSDTLNLYGGTIP